MRFREKMGVRGRIDGRLKSRPGGRENSGGFLG